MHQPHSSRRRGVELAVAMFYIALFVALIWPVYPRFATIQPRVLEMPFSLVYVVVCLLLSFSVLFAFYLWERGKKPGDGSDPGGSNASGGETEAR